MTHLLGVAPLSGAAVGARTARPRPRSRCCTSRARPDGPSDGSPPVGPQDVCVPRGGPPAIQPSGAVVTEERADPRRDGVCVHRKCSHSALFLLRVVPQRYPLLLPCATLQTDLAEPRRTAWLLPEALPEALPRAWASTLTALAVCLPRGRWLDQDDLCCPASRAACAEKRSCRDWPSHAAPSYPTPSPPIPSAPILDRNRLAATPSPLPRSSAPHLEAVQLVVRRQAVVPLRNVLLDALQEFPIAGRAQRLITAGGFERVPRVSLSGQLRAGTLLPINSHRAPTLCPLRCYPPRRLARHAHR
jgi:hypothetical protein